MISNQDLSSTFNSLNLISCAPVTDLPIARCCNSSLATTARYRIDALRDCLLKYSSSVTEAFDFLTKDMGEDRWLCTLLVMNGWRLDYTVRALPLSAPRCCHSCTNTLSRIGVRAYPYPFPYNDNNNILIVINIILSYTQQILS